MEVEKITDELHRILVPSPTLPPATTTNAWVLGAHKGIVIDPAAHTSTNQELLIERLTPFQPSAIFLTHHHHDHIGAAERLREHFQIPILAHKETENLLPFSIDQSIADGHVFSVGTDQWTAIHTPGHAPGHLCLMAESTRSVIAGDMVAGEGTILINPKEGSIREYIQSLELLRSLAPSRLLPAHGPALEDADSLLVEYIEHRLSRLAEIWSLLTHTAQTPRELAVQIYTELPTAYLGMAAIQVLCGLQYLEEASAAKLVNEHPSKGWVLGSKSYSIESNSTRI